MNTAGSIPSCKSPLIIITAASWLIVGAGVNCSRKETPVPPTAIISPESGVASASQPVAVDQHPKNCPDVSTLGFYSLSKQKDDAHPIAVVDAMGNRLYRAAAPGFSVANADASKLVAHDDSEGKFLVRFSVKADHQESLFLWSQQHVNQLVGYVCGEVLIRSTILRVYLRETLVLLGFDSLEEAAQFAESIRRMSGGGN